MGSDEVAGVPYGAASTVASSVTQTLAAGAMLVEQSAALLSDPAPTIGSAQLTTTGNVGGFVIFRYNSNGQEAVVPLENRTATQPVGWRPEMRDPKYPGTFWKSWGATLIAKRPEITLQTTDQFVTRMFETNPDFLFTVTRDFMRSCQNPILVLPDDVPAHPLAVAMECAMLAPKAEVSMFPHAAPARWPSATCLL